MDTLPKCPLCDRSGEFLQFSGHHIKTRRKSDEIVDMCKACHRAIHCLFTIKQIRDENGGCDSVEALRKNPELSKTLAFIRKMAPGARLRMSKRVGHTKYRGRRRT